MSNFSQVFAELATMLRNHTKGMTIKADTTTELNVDSLQLNAKGNPTFFGAVQVKKSYVSYHLMPVYEHPELLDDISAALRKKMQGKSCFNFNASDPTLFAELEQLTAKAAEFSRTEHHISPQRHKEHKEKGV